MTDDKQHKTPAPAFAQETGKTQVPKKHAPKPPVKTRLRAFIDEQTHGMGTWQLRLFWLCAVMVAWATVVLVVGILRAILPALAHVDIAEVLTGEAHMTIYMRDLTIFVESFIGLAVGFLGIRAAKCPRKMALFFWLVLAEGVLSCWALASSVSSGTVDVPGLVTSLYVISLAVCAWQVRALTGYFDRHPYPDGMEPPAPADPVEAGSSGESDGSGEERK